jgi:hypothetical protein
MSLHLKHTNKPCPNCGRFLIAWNYKDPWVDDSGEYCIRQVGSIDDECTTYCYGEDERGALAQSRRAARYEERNE